MNKNREENRSVFDLTDQIERKVPMAEGYHPVGAFAGVSTEGPRILMVDDSPLVVASFLTREAEYAQSAPELPCQLTMFRICGENGGRRGDFLEWLKDQPVFEGIYIDGNLESQGNGIELARDIRANDAFKYQPMALITAIPSFLTEYGPHREHEGLRIIGKFDKATAPIQQLVVELYDVQAHSRARFWDDVKEELTRELEEGKTPKEAAKSFGERLKIHRGAYAWYFRELRGDCLQSLAMEDGYHAPEALALDATPVFLREFIEGSENWMAITSLTKEQASPRIESDIDMRGHHVIAAKVGNQVAGDLSAVFTVYRTADAKPFSARDMIELHHVAVLLRLALAPVRLNESLKALTRAIDEALQEVGTSGIIARFCDFLQTQINAPLEARGMRTKSTARFFLRGTGELARWGQDLRKQNGSLEAETDHDKTIAITNKTSTYVRMIESDATCWSGSPDEIGKQIVQTVPGVTIASYLAVPLRYDGAIIGGLNLETVGKDAYSARDVSLAEAVAQVTAAAIFSHREQRFIRQLAALTADAIAPPENKPVTPEDLLDRGAKLLYRLTGCSELLFFEGSADLDRPWACTRGWQGNGRDPRTLGASLVEAFSAHASENWQETFLFECLQRDNSDTQVFRGSGDDGAKEENIAGLRNVRDKKSKRMTRQRTVVLLGSQAAHERALLLLFEHPHPMPRHYDLMLAHFARFLDAVYSTTFQGFHDFYGAHRALELEARAARVYSQARHGVVGHLASIKSTITLGRNANNDRETILDEVLEEIKLTEKEFATSRIPITDPVPQPTSWKTIWNDITRDNGKRIRNAGVNLHVAASEENITTDPRLAQFVLLHLLDNALVHGKANGANEIKVDAEGLQCVLCDNGRPLSGNRASEFFDLGYTSGSSGGGYGLYIAREIARDLGAKLFFELRQGRNCFVFKLGVGENGKD